MSDREISCCMPSMPARNGAQGRRHRNQPIVAAALFNLPLTDVPSVRAPTMTTSAITATRMAYSAMVAARVVVVGARALGTSASGKLDNAATQIG